jgi:hypothetical protein
MRIENIKHELKKILLVVGKSGMQNALQELLKRIEEPNIYIKTVASGKWVYFYLEHNKYDPETKTKGCLERKKLGRMKKTKFDNIDSKTLKEMRMENLKELLIEY